MTMPRQTTDRRATATASALRTLGLERAGIAALEAALMTTGEGGLAGHFAAAVELVSAISGRLIITGMGKSGHVGRKIAATMASTGTPSYFVHPGEASHGDLGMIQSGDAIVALSWSGETAELADIITYSRRFRIGLVGITSNPDSALAREADVALVLPRSEEACPNGLAPTTSTTMQLAIGDALAIALLEARGFTAQDFRVFHPGGKLGARLRFVGDVMHRDDQIPLVPNGARMGDALLEMTAKGFGCVGVVDAGQRLVGIITDGDLRRHMRPDLMARLVDDIMTRNPVTVPPETLAVEALEMLDSRRKNGLFVVDAGGRPCGFVRLHDLLALGVA